MEVAENDAGFLLSLANGIRIDVLARDGVYGGLGMVRLRQRKLRSDELPIMPLICTPDGFEVVELKLRDVERRRDAVRLLLTPYTARTGRTEWVCCDGQDRWNVGPWQQGAARDRGGSLWVTIRPVERRLGGIDFVGFSYGYKFGSRRHPVYRIHDRATWELGGRATGCSLWMCGPFSEPQTTFRTKADAFSTSWCRNGTPTVELQQFLPLFGVLQPFTFQFDRRGLLVTAFEQPFHCRSLVQKDPGSNCITHWHQLCGDLAGCLEPPPLQVLAAEGRTDRQWVRAGQYCAVRDELAEQYAERSRLSRDAATGASGVVLEQGLGLEALRRGVDALAHAGCTRVYLHGLDGRGGASGGDGRRKQARPTLARMRQGAKRLLNHAHQRGVEVALPLGCLAERWLAADGPGGDGEDEPPEGRALIEAALTDRRSCRTLIDHLRQVRKDIGVDAAFAETALEGIAEQFAWERADGQARRRGRRRKSDPPEVPATDDQQGRVLSLQARRTDLAVELQRLGLKCLLAGTAELGSPGDRVPYAALRGREFMFRDRVLAFPAEALADADADPTEVWFRGHACRVHYLLPYDPSGGRDGMPRWWRSGMAAINTAFDAMSEHMERIRLLPSDRGVLWSGPDPDCRVLWAYSGFACTVGPDAEVLDVMAGRSAEVDAGAFAARPFAVYLIQSAEGL